MDQLQTEKDRLQVKELVANFLQGDHALKDTASHKAYPKDNRPLIEGENRIHFISAYKALQANLSSKKNDYFARFERFTSSLENFLLKEEKLNYSKLNLKLTV